MSLIKAILEINPNAQVATADENIDTIEWFDTTPIPKAELEAKLDEILKRDAHKKKRAKEYPSVKDQLDDLYHNGIDGWKATIKAIKDKYPKEE
jgi:G3E family GTPase